MKREFTYTEFGGKRISSVITIDKDGLSVGDISCPSVTADTVLRTFITDAINITGWRHSQYVAVRNAKKRGSDERKKIASILDDLIDAYSAEVERLKDAKKVLRKWSW